MDPNAKKQEGTTGNETVSPAEAERIYNEELNRPEPSEEKTVAPAPEGKGASTADAGSGAPETKPAEGAAAAVSAEDEKRAKEEADKAAKDEAEFLKAIGFEGVAVPKELVPHLRKQFERFDQTVKAERHERNRWGEQNRQLAEQLKTLKKTMQEIQAQQTPADKLKGKISKIDVTKLSEGAQKLIKDPEFMEVMGVFLGDAAPAASDGNTAKQEEAEDLPEAVKAEVVKEHPDYLQVYKSEPFEAWAKKQNRAALIEKAKTAQGHKEILTQFKSDYRVAVQEYEKYLDAEIKKVHPDYEQVYASDDFVNWLKTQSPYEMAKVYDRTPRGHVEVLTNYAAYRAARKTTDEAARNTQARQDALGGLGDVNRGGRTAKDESEDDILNLSDEEYERRKQSAFARAGG